MTELDPLDDLILDLYESGAQSYDELTNVTINTIYRAVDAIEQLRLTAYEAGHALATIGQDFPAAHGVNRAWALLNGVVSCGIHADPPVPVTDRFGADADEASSSQETSK